MLNLERKVQNKVNYESYFFFKLHSDKTFFFIWEIDIITRYGVFNIKMESQKQQIEKNRDGNERSDFD